MSVRKKTFTALKHSNQVLSSWGIDGRKMFYKVKGTRSIRDERKEYERQRRASSSPSHFPITKSYPFFADRYGSAGEASGHYFHQDLYVAREIFRRNPDRHVDVGSSIYGFVSHVASFRTIEVLDIRPFDNAIDGISFIQQDIMNIDPSLQNSTDSLSCLHALEHFGLGRYSDPVDYLGWQKGLTSLTSMVKAGGILYLSVPTGSVQRVEFNAHRVFSIPFLRGHLEEHFEIEQLAFVLDDGTLLVDVDPHSDAANVSFEANYGCSIWVLRKKTDMSVNATPWSNR